MVTGLVARFVFGPFVTDLQARAAGVFVPIGFAFERYSFSGPPNLETLLRFTAALGSLMAMAILWRWLLRDEEKEVVT